MSLINEQNLTCKLTITESTKISYDTHMFISGFKRLLSKLIFSFSCSLIRDIIAYGDGKSYIKADGKSYTKIV